MASPMVPDGSNVPTTAGTRRGAPPGAPGGGALVNDRKRTR